jgi:hypothetical protein
MGAESGQRTDLVWEGVYVNIWKFLSREMCSGIRLNIRGVFLRIESLSLELQYGRGVFGLVDVARFGDLEMDMF